MRGDEEIQGQQEWCEAKVVSDFCKILTMWLPASGLRDNNHASGNDMPCCGVTFEPNVVSTEVIGSNESTVI